jgi:hypothetical protein
LFGMSLSLVVSVRYFCLWWFLFCMSLSLVVFVWYVSVSVYAHVDRWTDGCLASAYTAGRILFRFGIMFIDRRPLSGKNKQCSSKNKGPSPRLQNQNCDFLENDICELPIFIESVFKGQQEFVFVR